MFPFTHFHLSHDFRLYVPSGSFFGLTCLSFGLWSALLYLTLPAEHNMNSQSILKTALVIEQSKQQKKGFSINFKTNRKHYGQLAQPSPLRSPKNPTQYFLQLVCNFSLTCKASLGIILIKNTSKAEGTFNHWLDWLTLKMCVLTWINVFQLAILWCFNLKLFFFLSHAFVMQVCGQKIACMYN